MKIFFLILISLAGCLPEPPPLPPESSGEKAVDQNENKDLLPSGDKDPKQQGPNLPADPNTSPDPIVQPNVPQEPRVTFTKDILPLLSSVETGRVFKCTVCHRGYTDYETIANAATVGRILPKVLPGGNMPLNGDKLSTKDIQMILDWQSLGFPK